MKGGSSEIVRIVSVIFITAVVGIEGLIAFLSNLNSVFDLVSHTVAVLLLLPTDSSSANGPNSEVPRLRLTTLFTE